MKIVSQAQLARQLEISRQAVGKYIRKGLPQFPDGRLDLDRAVDWIARNQSEPVDAVDKGVRRAMRLARTKVTGAGSPNPVQEAADVYGRVVCFEMVRRCSSLIAEAAIAAGVSREKAAAIAEDGRTRLCRLAAEICGDLGVPDVSDLLSQAVEGEVAEC